MSIWERLRCSSVLAGYEDKSFSSLADDLVSAASCVKHINQHLFLLSCLLSHVLENILHPRGFPRYAKASGRTVEYP